MGLMSLMQINGLRTQLELADERIAKLEARATAAVAKADEARLRLVASEKVNQGANLTRAEVAAFLGVSFKKVQRLDNNGKGPLPRCPNMGTAVRYAARDVLRFASAPRKER